MVYHIGYKLLKREQLLHFFDLERACSQLQRCTVKDTWYQLCCECGSVNDVVKEVDGSICEL